MKDKAIICIDDEKVILDILRSTFLAEFGNDFEIEIAESATEAFEIIDELEDEGLKILAIVSDWLMPGMKGDEFLVQLHRKHPDIVKIMLTGQADEQAIENAKKNANLFACLYKPWDTDILIGTIKEGIKLL